MTDLELKEKVQDALDGAASVNAAQISVVVHDRVVTLCGHAASYAERMAAERAVRSLDGVARVHNHMLVKQAAEPKDLMRRISSALHRIAAAEASAITAEVVDGRVTLEGEVRSWHERRVIEEAVWNAPGVTAVEDYIRVR